MDNELQEYTIFHVTAKDGRDVEMAVIDEFEYDHRNYVVGALVEGDTISEEGVYIYRAVVKEDDFDAEQITDAKEYEQVVKAYMAL